jgi:hypothetical protein
MSKPTLTEIIDQFQRAVVAAVIDHREDQILSSSIIRKCGPDTTHQFVDRHVMLGPQRNFVLHTIF